MIYYKKKIQQDVGATAIEYGLIASLIGVLAFGGMSAVGVNLSNTYCTISKSLSGSGKCSGSGSSGTAGSGNTTTENGENDSVTPITTKEDMDNLKNSLKENFDESYVESNLGGTNSYEAYHAVPDPQNFLSTMNQYNEAHQNDQITHVFGLYDPFNSQPITSFAKASQSLNLDENDGTRVYMGKNNSETLEFTTQQGHVYTVDFDKTMTQQLPKGP